MLQRAWNVDYLCGTYISTSSAEGKGELQERSAIGIFLTFMFSSCSWILSVFFVFDIGVVSCGVLCGILYL